MESSKAKIRFAVALRELLQETVISEQVKSVSETDAVRNEMK